jgi:hypothetical protein
MANIFGSIADDIGNPPPGARPHGLLCLGTAEELLTTAVGHCQAVGLDRLAAQLLDIRELLSKGCRHCKAAFDSEFDSGLAAARQASGSVLQAALAGAFVGGTGRAEADSRDNGKDY